MSAAEELSEAEQLAEDMASFTLDPLAHAMYSYPWGEQGTSLADVEGPRKWQVDVLTTIRDKLQDPETRFQPIQIAIASGHGIGKSALIGMIINWALDTCEDCRIVCTANTDTQMKTKTVPEITKWANMKITSHLWNVASTSISNKAKEHVKTWRCDFVPWSKENSEAFAGLHNKGKRIVVIYDEASAIEDIIYEVTEGALTDEYTEIIWICFGNPTQARGRFRECFRKFSGLWITRHIDSRDVEGTNKSLFEKWAKYYGEDSDFFKVRVRGMFPSASSKQFISQTLIDNAKGRELRLDQYNFAPKIITCDPAWTGDDEIIIGMRQGLAWKVLESIPKNDDDILIANKIARWETEEKADAVFIDGGYGTGIYSAGKNMGRDWILVWFGGGAARQDCENKRAEMLVAVRDWLKEGGVYGDDDDMAEEMAALEVVPTMDGKYKFVKKEDVKKILGRSPNRLDALGLSFAHPVMHKEAMGDEDDDYAEGYDPFETR